MTVPERSPLRRALRAWYRSRRAAYPWRGDDPDPYAVLVSEVMLQQTQAVRVAPLYAAFLSLFPDVQALARAAPGDVLRAWAGLGYHRRAVALHRAARSIVESHAGRVPRDPATLRTLPGVGPYTASAVASIAYGVPVVAMDVNVRRVISRLMSEPGSRPLAAAEIAEHADRLLDRRDPRSWNQAVMDLGRSVCRPAPRCGECPLAPWCRSRGAGRDGGGPTSRHQPFAGSNREARGRVVAVLRERGSAGLIGLARACGLPPARVGRALDGLVLDGVVERRGRSYRLPA
jgi:A/G-specific adenine glycosylase